MVNEVVGSFLLVYAGLFPVVNPLGAAPIFLSMTRFASKPARHALAWRIARNSLFLLFGSLFVGSHVLVFFGITLPVVRIAGGLVVTVFGWNLLNKGDDVQQRQPAQGTGDDVALKEAFYPFTMPLTVGPGSISVAITLGSERSKTAESLGDLVLTGGGAIAGIVAIAATVYLSYRFADKIIAFLGKTGTNVLVRLSAFILLCIGIQIVWDGYSALTKIAAP